MQFVSERAPSLSPFRVSGEYFQPRSLLDLNFCTVIYPTDNHRQDDVS